MCVEFKPFEKKFVAVLNEKTEPGRAMNALAHMALGLGGRIEHKNELRLQDYTDANGTIHSSISDLPFIILKGTSGQIRKLRTIIQNTNVIFTDFTNTMIEGTYIEQHERTKKTKEENLDYFGICLFGKWDTVSELTRKFSVWK